MATGLTANYTRFAQLLAEYPDQLSLCRFRALHVRNLLLYQAELIELEKSVSELEVVDATLYPQIKDRVNYRWPLTLLDKKDIPAPSISSSTAATGLSVPGASPAQSLREDYRSKVLEVRETLRRYGRLRLASELFVNH
jgi:hypothetical protein